MTKNPHRGSCLSKWFWLPVAFFIFCLHGGGIGAVRTQGSNCPRSTSRENGDAHNAAFPLVDQSHLHDSESRHSLYVKKDCKTAFMLVFLNGISDLFLFYNCTRKLFKYIQPNTDQQKTGKLGIKFWRYGVQRSTYFRYTHFVTRYHLWPQTQGFYEFFHEIIFMYVLFLSLIFIKG